LAPQAATKGKHRASTNRIEGHDLNRFISWFPLVSDGDASR
jgi:hypothetical protein